MSVPTIEIGDTVRSFDFPISISNDHYIEGTVMEINPSGDGKVIEILCTYDSVSKSEDPDYKPRIGELIVTPINAFLNDSLDEGRIVIIEKRNIPNK